MYRYLTRIAKPTVKRKLEKCERDTLYDQQKQQRNEAIELWSAGGVRRPDTYPLGLGPTVTVALTAAALTVTIVPRRLVTLTNWQAMSTPGLDYTVFFCVLNCCDLNLCYVLLTRLVNCCLY